MTHPSTRACRLLVSAGLTRILLALLLSGTLAQAKGGTDFKHPPQACTRQGRERTCPLAVEYASNKICSKVNEQQGVCTAWDDVYLRSYNRMLVGPTIEAHPGDTLNITLSNQLPTENAPAGGDVNEPHGFNTTNLHTHGLHVSPAGNADNVMLALGPGQKFKYEIKIPADHPEGTFWYHAHKHGSVAIQLASGMAGALIVRGKLDEVPAIKQAKEKLFVFQQIAYVLNSKKLGEVESYELFGPGKWESSGNRTTINGVVLPTLELQPGEVQRWRFIHAGIREKLEVRLARKVGDKYQPIPHYQIALDGITTGRLDAVRTTELYPGYRADVLVAAPTEPGVYWLVDDESPTQESLRGEKESSKPLARVEVKGAKVSMALPTPQELAALVPFKPIEGSELTGAQMVMFHVDTSEKNNTRFLVNGRSYNPSATPRQLKLGAVEEWLVASSYIAGHPFHIHVNPFQVEVELEDEHGEMIKRTVWKDTLFVPAGEQTRLRTRYEHYIGTFVLHCHILDHEDQGMMETIEIVPPGSAHGKPDDSAPSLPVSSHSGH